MKGGVPDDRRWLPWRFRLIGAAILLALVIAVGRWPRSNVPGKNAYFRPGDPSPLAFPIIHTGMSFDELDRNPRGGEQFEIGFEWHPKSGPFDDIRAELAETGNLVCGQYHLRPQYLGDFKSSLDAVFAGYDRESGPNPGKETWPDVHGYRLTLDDGLYSVNPVDPDDLAVFRFTKVLKQGFVAILVLVLLIVSLRRRRLRST